ncbi:MAG: sulfite exporter TauE/SafE family protein, partial [Oscillospiraceae bacterium]|nr:sulfite exporter TauE/SafE family protein [Candidatus Equicaccousia limihippi]
MNEVLFILIMMLGIFIQAVTGFGGTLIAMPLGIAVMGISTTKPVLTVLVWITAVAVAAVRFKKINFKELFK